MSQARINEFYSTKKTTDNDKSSKSITQITDDAINQIVEEKRAELVRTRSIKKRACKSALQINTTLTKSARIKKVVKKTNKKQPFTEIKAKEPISKADGILKYTLDNNASLEVRVKQPEKIQSPTSSPKRRHDDCNSPSKRRKDEQQDTDDDKLKLAETIASSFSVRRNLFSSEPKTKCNILAKELHLDVTKPKDNVCEDTMTTTLSFTPVKSPCKKPSSTTTTRHRVLRGTIAPDPVVPVSGVDTALPSTPVKQKSPTSVFTTPVKEMTTMERLNSPAKKQTTASTSKPGPSKVVNKEEMKKRLIGCKKLDQLKDRLASFSGKMKAAEKILKSSPKKNIDSPMKAHEKYKDLATSSPKPSLSLPFKYRLLDDMFRGVDTILSMMDKRAELCTFSKLKSAVELMVKRDFGTSNLGQMKTVYPAAYTFRQEKGLVSAGIKTHGYQLTIEPLLAECEENKDEKPKFTPTDLIIRRNHFHNQLVEIVKSHHKVFLSNLDKPMKISDSKLQRWHPAFPIEDLPAVESAELPQPPTKSKPVTAAELLQQNRFKNPRIEKALRLASAAKESGLVKGIPSPSSPKLSADKSISLIDKVRQAIDASPVKGVALTLLDRIRAKESRLLQAKLCQTPEQVKRAERLSRLPDLIRIVRTFFINQKKAAMPQEEVIKSISSSYKTSLSMTESLEHLNLMVDLFPDWIQVITVSRGKFIKMNKNYEQSKIFNKLTNIQNAEKSQQQ